jgi:hypothetical protein
MAERASHARTTRAHCLTRPAPGRSCPGGPPVGGRRRRGQARGPADRHLAGRLKWGGWYGPGNVLHRNPNGIPAGCAAPGAL